MKKFLCILLCLLLLSGCSAGSAEETTPATEATLPSLLDQGRPWDREGVLLEVPLTVPESWKYSGFLPFGEDLLLWYLDSHLENEYKLGLCRVELSTGAVAAENAFPVGGYLTPQVLGNAVYLCDNSGGRVTQLDEDLQIVRQWQAEPGGYLWFMDEKLTLYRLRDDQTLTASNLSTSESVPVLQEASRVMLVGELREYVPLEYYDANTGAGHVAVLDLLTGQVTAPPFEGRFSSAGRAGDYWLCSLNTQTGGYYLGMNDHPFRLQVTASDLLLLKEGYLLEIPYDGQCLRLYDTAGKLVSQCRLSEDGNCYANYDMIWNEALGGYFFRMSDYDGGTRLMFWDISKSSGGEDLRLEAVPAPSQATAALREKADALEEKYGLSILVGTECSTEFDSFSAQIVEDFESVSYALDTLEQALRLYPEGFFRQLRYGSVQGVEIQLVGNLTATDEGRLGGSYSAFVQEQWDKNLMVADVYTCFEHSYYHEFSHVIDNYLTWDSWQRNDALFSEEAWADLSPAGFDYAYDYGAEFDYYLTDEEADYFIDSYSTVSPTEDRARVMEYAMMDHSSWVFEEKEGMYRKLEYYAQCIREVFDTEGWPETLPWEQYLR